MTVLDLEKTYTYCPEKGCPGGRGCANGRDAESRCVFEYVASDLKTEHQWKGETPPPRRWTAPDGTIVYRSYADYCG